jgi:hypothetical protein
MGDRSPETMLETFHWFRGEGFGLIVEDLLRLPTEPGVIVEGFRLLPCLVKPLLAVPGHAVWLLPTPGFRRAAFESRGSLWRSRARPAIRGGPCATCSSAIGCSRNGLGRKRSALTCRPSRSTPP